jgi:hypothetical protein
MLSKEEIILSAMRRYWETKDGANDIKFQSVEELKKYMDNPDMKLFLEVMEEYANQDKWISVTDELPEIGEYVTCHNTEGCISTGRLLNNGFTMFFADGEQLAGELSVTHWQKLPNPPKQ